MTRKQSIRRPRRRPPNVSNDADAFDLTRIRQEIKPFRLYWFPRLTSTNDHAARLRRQKKLFAPAVVLAGRQIAGRGRGSNRWWSAPGSLTVTFVLPIQDHLLPQQIPLLAGLLVRNAVAEVIGSDSLSLKWPNDILHHGKKVAGLLCERIERADLVGVGINANVDIAAAPASLKKQITSLSQIAHHPVNISSLLIEVARSIAPGLLRGKDRPFAAVLKEYDRHNALTGRRITVQAAGEETAMTGICAGLDSAGQLLLRSGGRSHKIIAGHVHMHE
jgi:BirA family biotin operon repressor/biotin-[acetyl-CoA-carboxylase] ligase